jgi:hypothetical protein
MAQTQPVSRQPEVCGKTRKEWPRLRGQGPGLPPGTDHRENQGEGIGPRVSEQIGRDRLTAKAARLPIEAWAGPVMGPTELRAAFGISRSTLHSWHQRKAVIGLLKGTRHHVFPIAQFIDGRPLQGLSQVLDAVGQERAAWLWLKQPRPNFKGRPPLDRLAEGHVAEVIEAARLDFA